MTRLIDPRSPLLALYNIRVTEPTLKIKAYSVQMIAPAWLQRKKDCPAVTN